MKHLIELIKDFHIFSLFANGKDEMHETLKERYLHNKSVKRLGKHKGQYFYEN